MITPLQYLNQLASDAGVANPHWTTYAVKIIAELLKFGTIGQKKITIVEFEKVHTIVIENKK